MRSIAQLGLEVNSSQVKDATRSLNSFSKSGGKAEKASRGVKAGFKGAALAATAVVTAMLGIGQAISVISSFESSMSKVEAVTGAAGVELGRLRDTAKDLGATTEFSAGQAADALGFLGMAGFTAAEGLAAIPAVLDLATASGLGLARSADIASNVLSGFSLEAGQAGKVADVLAAASSSANTSVGQLGGAMSTVAPIAASLKISLETTAAAIGVMSDAGIQGERAGTALRGVLASLAGPTTQAQDALAKYGLTIADVNPATRNLSDIMAVLGERGLTTADAMTIFGREAASGALVLVGGAARLRSFTSELEDADGAAKDMAETMRDNLGGDINSLRSSVEGLILAFGDAGLTLILRTVIQVATGVVRVLTDITNAIGDAVKWVVSLGSFSSALDDVETASEAANETIKELIGQVDALNVAAQGGKIVTLDHAGAMLANAKAALIAADATRQLKLEQIKSSEVFQKLIEDQRKLNEAKALFEDVLSDNPSAPLEELLEPFNLQRFANNTDALVNNYTRLLERLKENVAQQELLTGAVGGTNEEQADSLLLIEQFETAIENAKNGMVILGAKISDARTETKELSGSAKTLADGIRDAANAALDLVSNLGTASLAGLRAEVAALAGGLGSGDVGVAKLEAEIRASKEFQLALSGPSGLKAAALAGLRDELILERERIGLTERRSKLLAGINTTTTASAGAASQATKSLADEIERLEFDADPIKKYNAELEKLEALAEAGLSDGAFNKAVQDLNDSLADQLPLIGDVADAWGDFVTSGFTDFKGFVKNVLSSFRGLISEMIATAARNKIIIGLGVGGSGIGGVATAATGGGGGGGGSLLSNLLSGSGIASSFLGTGAATGALGLPAIFSGGGLLGTVSGALAGGAAGTGILGSIGGFISGGISSAVGGITGGLAAGGFAGIAGAIGAAIPVLGAIVGIIAIGKKLFGRKLRDTGIQGTFDFLEGLEAQSFKFFKGGFFRSNKTVVTALDAAVSGPLDDAFRLMSDNVIELAESLNVLPNFSDLEFNFKFSTSGLSQEKVQEKFQELILSLGDNMADMIVGLGDVSQSGETSFQTLQRLSGSLAIVNNVFRDLGFVLKEASIFGSAAASDFAGLFGGLEQFTSATKSFYANFFTQTERTASATRSMTEALADLGVDVLPRTRRAFRDLVDGAMSDGDEGLAASLIMLSSGFSDLISVSEQAASATDALTQAENRFATKQEEIFTRSGLRGGFSQANETTRTDDVETQMLLRELLTEIKTGNINISSNTSKTAQLLQRIELNPAP